MSNLDTIATMPFACIAIGALMFLLLDIFREDVKPFPRVFWGVGISLSTAFLCWPFARLNESAFGGMLAVDPYSFIFMVIILVGTAITFLLGDEQQEGQKISKSVDVDILILMASLGGMVMVSATNLILLFVGFELLSISVYVLAGLAKFERASSESAMKYFILGAFSSAFLLYGMALVYGATGSMQLVEIGQAVSSPSTMLLVGIGLMIFGFGFKVSLVPFHFWTPDVYHGAPSGVSAYMAVVVKAAAFGTFFRIMATAFGGIQESWATIIVVLSILSMTYGNLVALRQKSIKRMLAYSSIAHAGYALIAFLVDGDALIFYMIVYALMTFGSFGVVLLATSGSDAQYDKDDVKSLEGIGWTHPLLGISMTIAMLSLSGIPPLAGFMGKFYLFSEALSKGYVALVVVAAINSVISLYYYLRVIVVMYFSGERTLEWSPSKNLVLGPRFALMFVTFGTIYLGLFSGRYVEFAKLAANSF